ncbi:hypothetical protein [Corynebacterium freiburgense]|uniref:hypothetical protein n=1 Tax=Corynebacterium freiburgense TaxID=556548 RepID=UPI00040FE4EF|nr:hypothetical protein [Corynebacterium freiburgense]WJZ03836.1 hypothetical protein CFREI_12910 [Corynebacterium freiburgense]
MSWAPFVLFYLRANGCLDEGLTLESATTNITNQLEADLIHLPVDDSRAWISVTVDMDENVIVATIPNDVCMGTAGVVKALRKTGLLAREDVDCYADLLQNAVRDQLNNPSDLQVGYYKGLFGVLGEVAALGRLQAQKYFEVADILEDLMDTCNSNFGSCADSLDMLTGTPGILFARANSPSKGVEKLAIT